MKTIIIQEIEQQLLLLSLHYKYLQPNYDQIATLDCTSTKGQLISKGLFGILNLVFLKYFKYFEKRSKLHC